MKKLWPIISIIAVLLLVALAYVNYQTPSIENTLPPANTDQPSGGIPIKIDAVQVDYPKSGSIIKSPVTITGQALGV
jgi:biopolymer transport protein ExbD